MAFDQAYAKKVQDHLHGNTALPQPAGHKLLLMTANGTSSAAGTELASGAGYVAGTGQPLTFASATTATPSVSATSVTTSFTNMPATTIVGVEIHVTTHGRTEFGALAANKTTALGDTLSFASGAIASALQ